MARKQVIIALDVEGFHLFANAKEPNAYLADKHRHTFTIKCGFSVKSSDREIEIFEARDMLRDYIGESYGYPADFGGMSCEEICEEVLDFLEPEGILWCEVWEEQTGGARVEA